MPSTDTLGWLHHGAVEKVRCWLIPLLWRGGRRSLTGWCLPTQQIHEKVGWIYRSARNILY